MGKSDKKKLRQRKKSESRKNGRSAAETTTANTSITTKDEQSLDSNSSLGNLLFDLSWKTLGLVFLLVVLILVVVWPLPPENDEQMNPSTDAHSRRRIEDQSSSTPNTITKPGSFQLLNTYPHPPQMFTQGLTYFDQKLYEGTGNYGESVLRLVDIDSGDSIQTYSLDKTYFGEGIAHFRDDQNNRDCIIQLTYKSQKGFIYDVTSTNRITKLSEFNYTTRTGEGWGITYNPDGQEFIVSDGSDTLYVWDRDTLQEKRRIQIRIPVSLLPPQVQQQHADKKELPMPYLNELEWDRGTLLANLWYQDVLLRVDVESGLIIRNYDFSTLFPRAIRPKTTDCFNGIALTDTENEFFVTGKWWPNVYRIRLID